MCVRIPVYECAADNVGTRIVVVGIHKYIYECTHINGRNNPADNMHSILNFVCPWTILYGC